MSRKVDYYTYYNWDSFFCAVRDTLEVLTQKYHFFFCGKCFKISKPINEVIKNKRDFYKGRVNLYYDDEQIYLVAFQKNRVVVDVLITDCLDINTTRKAHSLARNMDTYKTVY